MYGPVVLAGKLGRAGLTAANLRAEPTRPRTVPEYKSEPVSAPTINAPTADPASWLMPIAGKPLEFQTRGQSQTIAFEPLYRIIDERYAVYWKVTT
jgi:hypothetical protein